MDLDPKGKLTTDPSGPDTLHCLKVSGLVTNTFARQEEEIRRMRAMLEQMQDKLASVT
jgi:hypothetical protein